MTGITAPVFLLSRFPETLEKRRNDISSESDNFIRSRNLRGHVIRCLAVIGRQDFPIRPVTDILVLKELYVSFGKRKRMPLYNFRMENKLYVWNLDGDFSLRQHLFNTDYNWFFFFVLILNHILNRKNINLQVFISCIFFLLWNNIKLSMIKYLYS